MFQSSFPLVANSAKGSHGGELTQAQQDLQSQAMLAAMMLEML